MPVSELEQRFNVQSRQRQKESSFSERGASGNGGRWGTLKGENQERFANALGWFSIGLGLAEIVVPKQLGNLIGTSDHEGLMRGLGAREMAAGVGILAQRQPAEWLWARVAGDFMDLALLGTALAKNKETRTRLAVATAAVGGVTALDIICSLQVNRAAGRVHFRESIAVNRSPEECYQFWRNFENLPRFMAHLESVRTTGGNRSRWIAKAPAGMRVEWDAEIVRDTPNEVIGWRSVEGADVHNAGRVEFERRPAGRGTIVRTDLHYRAPGGKLGVTIAKLFGEEPQQQARGDLRRFKQVLETGEIPTTAGQPAGPALSNVLRANQGRQS